MKPVDPRLLRYARSARFFLAASVALGLAGAVLLIAQAMLIADLVTGAFVRHAAPAELRGPALELAAVAVGRAAVAWLTELAAHRSSAAVKSQLRTRLLTHAAALGPSWLTGQRTGELAALAGRGIDALDDYFARYLPQLGLAAVIPAAVLARVVTEDWISAAVIAGTLPLIPLFMVLIGWATQSRTDRQWRLLSRLSGHFLDVVAGLPTLKVFGRAKAQAAGIRAITDDYRRATLRTLRLAFLSSFALELLATISVALVAVGIGMRLVAGELDLYTGLLVLVLAPEAYLPLRQVGARYHAAAEGLTAAGEVFAVLETPPPEAGRLPAPDARTASITVEDVVVRHEGRTADSLPATSLTLFPGETVAVTGPSGAGKSTLLHALLGFARPTAGRIRVRGGGVETVAESAESAGESVGESAAGSAGESASGAVDLADLAPESWHAQIAWLPQHPYLFAGTVADNVRLARADATDEAVRTALREAQLPDLDPAFVLGEEGAGLSAGQRRRVALARAFLADRPVLLLDEPTAALDGESEAAVVAAIRRLARGRTTVLVTHRPALLSAADRVLRLPAANAPAGGGRWGTAVLTDTETGTASGLVAGTDDGPESRPDGRDRRAPGGAGEPAEASPHPAQPGPRAAAEAGNGTEAGAEPGGASTAGRRAGLRREPRPLTRLRRAAGALRPRFALAILLGALALASAAGLMATSGWLISRASQQPPILYLMVAVTATRAFGIGRAVFRYAERLVSHDAVLRVLAELRVHVHRRLERLAPAGLRHARRGDLLARLVADVDSVQDYFLRWLLPAAVAAVVSVAATGFAGAVLPGAGAVLGGGLLVAGVAVPVLTHVLARRTERRLAPARAELTTRTLDLLSGVGESTVAGALPARTGAVRAADRALTRIAARSAAVTALAAGLSALASGLTVAAAAWVGANAVYEGRLPGVWLAVVVLLPLAAFEAVAGLPAAVQYRQQAKRSAERVYEVLDAPPPVREPVAQAEPPRELPLGDSPLTERSGEPESADGREPAGEPDAAGGPESAEADAEGTGGSEAAEPVAAAVPRARRSPSFPFPVTVRGLTVRYPDAPAAAPAALAALDLDLTPGRRVAVVGASGSGKTTLAYALLRFLDPELATEQGGYTLGGVPAAGPRGLHSDTVRQYVGLCAQDAHVFDSSLRENLRLARPSAATSELWSALAAARLDDWIRTLPHGLDTLVGEHGARLSGGQRQRLALARALLADFPVLVLDEPAEHLDPPTADALTADLLDATRGRTTLLITHRLRGLDEVDEVLVLDRGRTVQRGPYARLAAAEGPFRSMLDREAATGSMLGREAATVGRRLSATDVPGAA